MSDIFISYARSKPAPAQQVARVLRALGYGVWLDDEIPAHRAYTDVLAEKLEAAKAVVVVWSEEAARSDWVRSEAEAARQGRKLVQLTADGARLPMPFDQIECANLVGWAGEAEAPGWRKIVLSLTDLVGPSTATPNAAPPPAAPTRSVCVLPFANMSGDAEQEYFSDGISEDIITDLSKVSALFVVARTTAFALRGKDMGAQDVARDLNVRHVLTGSVRKADGRVRISAELIDGATGGQVWAERYDRDLKDIFALQDEISQAIVEALKVRLLPQEKKAIAQRGTDNAAAYDLYLMARQAYVDGDEGDPKWGESIVRLSRRATQVDPGYASAWALLALGHAALGWQRGVDEHEGFLAAERALALAPDLAEAHAVMARILTDGGRHAEAVREIQIALRLEPRSRLVNYTAGLVWYAQGQIEDAIRYFEAASEIDETDFKAPHFVKGLRAATGDRRGALQAAELTLAHVENALEHDRDNAFAMSVGSEVLGFLGRPDRAQEWLERAMSIDPTNPMVRFTLAGCLAAHLKNTDAALDMLAPALADMGAGLFTLLRATNFDPLRDHPRFKAMTAEVEARLAQQRA